MPNFKAFVDYDAEGDSFTLHFYLGKAVGGAVVPCLLCGQTMSGLVGPLGICTGNSIKPAGKCCNSTIFPYLSINRGEGYHDYPNLTAAQLEETRAIAIKYLTEIEPSGTIDDWNVDGLNTLIRLIDEAIADRSTVRDVTRIDEKLCAQCGFKEPCSCAAFSQQEVN